MQNRTSFFSNLNSSAKELKSVKSITMCGALIALYIVLDYIGVKIPDNQASFSFITFALLGHLFGPVTGTLASIPADLISVLTQANGAPFWGFTISAMLTCFVFSFFLYKRTPKLWRIIAARAIINIGINSFLNPFWLTIILPTPKAYSVYVVSHLIKNLGLLIIEIPVLWLVLNALKRINK